MSTKQHTAPPRPGSIAAAPSIEEFLAGLLWPRLLQAAPLALRASRVGLAVLTLVLVGAIGSLSLIWSDLSLLDAISAEFSAPLAGLWQGVLDLDWPSITRSIRHLVFEAPVDLVEFHPWKVLFTGLPALAVFAVGIGSIARSAACEFSQGVRLRASEALGFGMARAKSFLGALLATPILAAVLAVGIAVVSWPLFAIPYINVIGAVAYPLALVLSAACVILLVGYVLAGPLLVPAVACEGTDAVDAIQRSYAYALGRPARLVLYALVLVAQGVIAFAVLSWLADRTIGIAAWSAGALLSTEDATILRGSVEAGKAGHFASSLIEFWGRCIHLLVGAYALSFFACAGTVLYLVLRRLCDGQDLEELWMPGMIPGTMAKAESAPGETDDDDE